MDGVYRRARLEEMVNNVRGQMQYLDRVGVFTVDCGEKEMVKPSDLSYQAWPRWWWGASWTCTLTVTEGCRPDQHVVSVCLSLNSNSCHSKFYSLNSTLKYLQY